MTACIRILYTLSILIKLLWQPKPENFSGKQKFLIYGTQYFLYFWLKSACDADPCENDATCQAGYTQKKYRCLCPSGFTGENCESGKHYDKRYFVFKLIQSAKCQWNNQRTALDRKSLVLGFIQLLWLFYGKGSRFLKKTELSTQILAVNNHIYYMEESVLLGTKPLVDSIRHFIREPSGVFSVCHLCECRIVQWRLDSRLLLLLKWFLHIII